MQQNLPNATLILYPDASHGSLFQYPETFVTPRSCSWTHKAALGWYHDPTSSARPRR
ncbi:Hypothetical protein LPU83_0360 [Rhizobium favelukesii]|uniref:Uncharacterized protein n=1 Tax=Rhizobium favelukesii TaxID=348824 RepID=W6RBH1_9HYPH|nr:Hypothetical protein LPU83_0360 [Rhizobium favelukesii]